MTDWREISRQARQVKTNSVSAGYLVLELDVVFWKSYIDVMKSSVIEIDPEKMSGVPVFRGTRVPIRTLLDYLEGGETIDDFLEGFPGVTRDQAIRVLEEMKEQVFACA